MDISYNYDDVKKYSLITLRAGRTPAIWGAPGIGKSTLGREIAEELGAELYVLDAPLLQPFDYAIAVPDHESKKVTLYPTGFLPEKGPAVVLVEDLPHAKSYQMIPIMQMVLDRRIGHMRFTDDVYFIITGNREEDLAGVNPIPSPLLNRLVHYPMDVDVERWVIWGKSAGLDERITGFISANPQHLLKKPEDGVRAWPTPRSWHMLSDQLKKASNDDTTLRSLTSSTIGPQVTHVFMAWVKYLQTVDPKDIIENGAIPSTSDRGQMFALLQSVAGLLKQKKPDYIQKHKGNVVDFFKWLQGEFKMAFLKEMVTYDKKQRPEIKYLEMLFQIDPIFNEYASRITGMRQE